MDQPDARSVQTMSEAEASPLRWRTADVLQDHTDVIVADVVAAFPSATSPRLDTDYCVQLGRTLVRLIADAVRRGSIDARSGRVVDLIAVATQRNLAAEQIVDVAHLALSSALDELSLDPQLGHTSNVWPQVVSAVRRAVFAVLGAWAARSIDVPSAGAITDTLTTLHTRPVLELALFKECQRAERFEHWLSMILLDIDNLSEINRAHGYGVGDRVLERMGILLRTFFRQHDWVARYGEDEIAVLLPETSPEDALSLADRTRSMIEERLAFRDYRTEERATVTTSIAVASARALEGDPIDFRRVLQEIEAALDRAKTGGRNRVEAVEILPRLMSINEAAAVLSTDLEGIETLVGEGTLEPITAGKYVRLDRGAVMQLANAQK